MKEARSFNAARDSKLVVCRHTALIPQIVRERDDGQVEVIVAVCDSCHMVLQTPEALSTLWPRKAARSRSSG
jgi:hypothetical protein